MPLTKRDCDRATYPEEMGRSAFVVWDSGSGCVPGFGLRVHPTGRKSFVFKYREQGRRARFYVIGAYGPLTVKKARELADGYYTQVRAGEPGPAARRDSIRSAKTITDLCSLYLERHAIPKKAPGSVRNDRQMIRDCILPLLGQHSVESVTRADVVRLHHSMRATPYAANRVLSLLSKMMTLAEVWGIRTEGTNPCRHVQRFKENARTVSITPAELGRLGQAMREIEEEGNYSPSVVPALRLALFTGCRIGEVLAIRWEHVDLDRGLLYLPRTKRGARHVVLNAPALDVLAKRTTDSEWVFPGKNGSLIDVKRPWAAIRKRAELPSLRIHDLRHMHGDTGAGLGLGLPIIGALLGHTQAATTERYARPDADPIRRASETIGATLRARLDGEVSENIASFPGNT